MRIAIFPIEKEKYQKDNRFSISTEIAYIITYLENNNPEDIVFPCCDLDFLSKTKPDIVCIYAPYSFTYEQIVSISHEIKEKYNIPIILSGEHITALPKTLPSCCDIGILGDPEENLKNIIELKRNDLFNEKNFSKIPGLVFSYKNQKVITDKPQYIKDIDSLPMTRAVFQDMPGDWIPSIIIGRGKPVNNSWQNLTNQPVRLFSIDRITQDIVDLIANNYGLKISNIKDYLLLYDKNYFRKFISMYRETNLVEYMRFNVKALMSQLDEEVIYELKHTMQIPKLTIQMVNPLEKFYKDLKEDFVPYSQQKKILDLCFKYNINVEAKFLYNLPNETKEDTTKSYWFIKRNYFERYNTFKIKMSPLSLSPGSELWQKAILKKAIMENFNNWSSLNKFDEKTPVLSLLGDEISHIHTYLKNSFVNKNDYFKADFNNDPVFEHLRNASTQTIKDSLNIIKENFSQYRYIDTEQLEKVIFKSLKLTDIDENMIFTLEEIINSSNNISTLKVTEKISQIKRMYQELKSDDFHNQIYYSNNINYLALEPILHEISKNANLKNILQISEKSILDLKSIFKNDHLDIDTLNPNLLNKPIIDVKLDKKYDVILLYFTLDFSLKYDKILSFCRKSLNDNGLLILPFYNSKNVISLVRMLSNKNINNLFYNYKRTNFYTLESMGEILKKNSFLIKEIDDVSFPVNKKLSVTEKVFKEVFFSHLNDKDTDKLFYVYVCRKA